MAAPLENKEFDADSRDFNELSSEKQNARYRSIMIDMMNLEEKIQLLAKMSATAPAAHEPRDKSLNGWLSFLDASATDTATHFDLALTSAMEHPELKTLDALNKMMGRVGRYSKYVQDKNAYKAKVEAMLNRSGVIVGDTWPERIRHVLKSEAKCDKSELVGGMLQLAYDFVPSHDLANHILLGDAIYARLCDCETSKDFLAAIESMPVIPLCRERMLAREIVELASTKFGLDISADMKLYLEKEKSSLEIDL